MTELSHIPWYVLAIPCCALVGAYIVSKILRLSLLVSVLGGAAPLALPYTDLSFSPQLAALKPLVQMGGAWGLLLCSALGWVLVRGAVRSTSGPLIIVRIGYLMLLCSALAVVGLLIAEPKLLDSYAPGWRGAAGISLLCATLLSMSLAFVRVFKTAALLALWSFASLVLASQIFFEKMPNDLIREDLHKIESSVNGGLARQAVRRLGQLSDESS
jgi:hypothetical protein